ncbi:MAG: RND family transporter [Thermoplasmata archaeon]|nr:MAG: RND family transporter [Thermoplasmata archaeon]
MRLIANGVEKRPKAIVIAVIIITIIISGSLVKINVVEEEDEEGKVTTRYEVEPAISFRTDVEKFIPDNPIAKAIDRVEEKFGADFLPHVIYAQAVNPERNIITPKAIREMYFASVAAREVDGVEGSISFADAINELSKYRQNSTSGKMERNDYYNLGRLNFLGTDYLVSDDDIQGYLDLIFEILNGTIDIEELAEDFQVPIFNLLDEIEFVFDLIHLVLSEDFTIESQKAEATIIIVQMNGTLSNIEAKDVAGNILNAVEELEFQHITTRQTSQYLISYDIDLNSIETFQFLAGGIFGLIIIVLALSFRRLSYVLIPILTLLIATIWTIGTMYFLGLTITAMMVAVIPLLIGLGVDYSVHVLRRYQEELRKGVTVNKAIRSSIINVGGAIGLAMITTVIAFLSNLTSAVTPIRDFGISCAAGVFYAFLLTMTFHCALRTLIDKRALNKYMRTQKGKNPLLIGTWHTEKDKKMGLYDRFSNMISKVVLKAPVLIAVLTVLLTIGAIVAAANVESEFTMEEFLPEDWESVETSYLLREDFEIGSYSTAYIIIEGDDIATTQSFFGINETIERIKDDEHVVKIQGSSGERTMVFSILDISKFMVALNSSLETEFNLTPDGMPNVTCTDQDIKAYFDYIYFNDTVPVGNQTFGSFVQKMIYRETDGRYTASLIRVFTSTFTSTDTRVMYKDLKNDIKDIDYGGGSKATITGLMVLTIDVIDSLQVNMINSTFIAVILAAIILIFLYRSVVLGIMPPIPVVLCSLWIVGTMYLLSYSLNILTVMVTALTIGLGIDYSIHVMERFREEREKHKRGIQESVHTTIMSTGTALTISALTTILGFGVLVFSPMPIAQQFGVITAITIIYSFLAAVLVLPVILIAWAKRKEKKELANLPQFSSLQKIEVKKGK